MIFVILSPIAGRERHALSFCQEPGRGIIIYLDITIPYDIINSGIPFALSLSNELMKGER